MTVPRRDRRAFRQRSSPGGKEKMKKMNNLNILKLENAVLQKQIVWYGEIYAPDRTGILHGKK